MQHVNRQVGMAGTNNTHGQTRKDNRDTQNTRTYTGGGGREGGDTGTYSTMHTDRRGRVGGGREAGTHNIHGQTRRDTRDIQYPGKRHEGAQQSRLMVTEARHNI